MGREWEVESRMMHVEKLRAAIGFPREMRSEAGTPTRLGGTFSMSLPGHMDAWKC
jgi:hypothetical protein